MLATAEFAGVTIFTTAEIASGEVAAGYVYRQPGTGLWYVLDQPTAGDVSADQMVPMRELLAFDPTLVQLANMPPGMGAIRPAPGVAWAPFKIHKRTRPDTMQLREEETRRIQRTSAAGQMRLHRAANRLSFALVVPGTLLVAAGGLIALGLRAAETVLGVPAHIAYGVLLGGAGALLFIAGLVVGTRFRASWALFGAALMSVVLAVPATWDNSGVATVFGILRDRVRGFQPRWLASALGWSWNEVTVAQMVAALLALVVWGLAIWLIVAKRHAPVEEAQLEPVAE